MERVYYLLNANTRQTPIFIYEVQHKQAHWVMNARKANNLATHNAQTYNLKKLKNLQTHQRMNLQTQKLTNSSTYKLINSKTHQLKNLNRYFLFYNSAQIFSPF